MPLIHWSEPIVAACNILGVLVQHLGVAWLAMRLPLSWFRDDLWWWRTFAFERQGQLWNRLFAVKRWKKHLPDGAAWLGGFSKKRLHSRKPAYLLDFIAETRRAEASHWTSFVLCPLYMLYNPPWAATIMIGYTLIANLPCILAQRVNRPWLLRIAAHSRDSHS